MLRVVEDNRQAKCSAKRSSEMEEKWVEKYVLTSIKIIVSVAMQVAAAQSPELFPKKKQHRQQLCLFRWAHMRTALRTIHSFIAVEEESQ